MHQIKATVRNERVANRAATATEALRLLRELQAKPQLRSCAVLRGGAIVGQAELESAARREQG